MKNRTDIRPRSFHTYVVSPVGVFSAFVTVLVLLFLFLSSPTGGKKLCCRLKISSHFKTPYRRIVPLEAKEHPQMHLSSSINAGQRVMRCPICFFRSKNCLIFFFLHMTVLQFDLLFMPSRY